MAAISNNGTTKQKPRLDLDGYSYIKDRSTNEKTYWGCIKYSTHRCRSRLHTCVITNNIIKTPIKHTCKSDAISFEQQKFDERIAHRARFTQEAPDLIVTDCYKGMTDQAIARLPTRDNVKRRTRMLRQNKHVIAIPNDLNFESIPTSLTKTIRLDQFLRCDAGSVFAHNIHKLAALAFLKPDDVVKGFEALSLTLDDDDYQSGCVLGRLRANLTRRKPTYSIEFWNMYNWTTHSLMRTYNAAEAYHRRIESIFQCAHPTLWVFLQKLIDEENATHAGSIQIRAGQHPKTKKNSEHFEKRLINLISNLHQDILTQINSLAHNISL
ncbi:unnamed protein product [Rotaria sordida]|uniref:FLYWCH-type domain-containing protein n=1 Tax=Rotaria sordida TaxID=392033 RepID=A0A814SKB5_9BILA|nr:unnamed protein product [Rotaria sordida]CAF1405694.1 unnamed protein product [Rotaria sordida]CAF3909887.1 unnamed protein product [Rotaria sordida]CAF4044807.1 unnamed protein product [Rotaria sordida]